LALNLAISLLTSRAPPANASAIAVLSTSATVMLMLRRSPLATPDITKLERIKSSRSVGRHAAETTYRPMP
jgi:hypothetical protein